MMEAVHHFEGTVNQVMGDGIMALFGAPLAHEDHAVRACYAALRMQESVKEYSEGIRRPHGFEVQIRVGLNSGEVVVRSLGSDLRMDYTAVGQTTHLAARMEQSALPGAILMAAETLRLAEDYIEVELLGPMPVRGLVSHVEVYQLTRARAVRSRFQARQHRGLTRFIGRGVEMGRLRLALKRARRSHGQAVAIVGDPGIGKSRLAWEFIRSHYAIGDLILETGCVPYGTVTPWLPMVDLLKDYFGVESRDDAATVRDKLERRLRAVDVDLLSLSSAVLALFDVAVHDPAWAALDSRARRQQTLAAVKCLVFRASQDRPTVLVVEDLQWIDGASQALLDGLVESLPESRLLLLVTYRPEFKHKWAGRAHFFELPVASLEQRSSEEFLHALLGGHPDLTPIRRLLVERTEGNPFFIEESIRSLADAGIIAGERGAYWLAAPSAAVQVPATVYAVLAARIDRLSPKQKHLLQTASVVGRDVPLSLLRSVAEMSEEALARDLSHLLAAEFVYERALFAEPEYTFKHALTHEVAYQGLLRGRQRELHGRVLQAIETLHADRLPEQVDRLAHHAFFGEVWDKAVLFSRQAGTRALARSAHAEAVVWCARALRALDQLPPTRPSCSSRRRPWPPASGARRGVLRADQGADSSAGGRGPEPARSRAARKLEEPSHRRLKREAERKRGRPP